MTEHPYRVEDPTSDARAELVYVPTDRERHAAPARHALQIGIVGGVGGVIAAGAGFPLLGGAALVLTTIAAAWRWRRAPEVAGIAIVVERGSVIVTHRASKEVLVRTRLVNLLDVALDTKAIRKVVPGNDAIPAVQFINTSVGPEVDVARIVFELDEDRAPVPLSEQFLAHVDAVEWIAKIRSFLRKHGWIPEDERPDSESDHDGDNNP